MPLRHLPPFAQSVATLGLMLSLSFPALVDAQEPRASSDPLDAAVPNEAIMAAFTEQSPIYFITRGSNAAEWAKLPAFWNEGTEEATDPITGSRVTRRIVRIKVPLGLNTAPVVPTENPMTVAKWELGKKLYFDKSLSTSGTISCASCHAPNRGFTDQRKTSLGIHDKLGGMNAPTVINSALNRFQFWDGRAVSLEDQAQGPVGNPVEMFGGKGDPWDEAIQRVRAKPEYVEAFRKVFGHAPTRDAAAKAIAAYERTVLSGNSLHDRAEAAMRKRVAEEEGKPELTAADYAMAIQDAIAAKDEAALSAVGLPIAAEATATDTVAKKLAHGRTVFFGKARCSNCHVGDNFTDNAFHNLGAGLTEGQTKLEDLGRYSRLPTGAKDHTQLGAFKTPGLRALVGTQPYMHTGEESTLEAVVDFYDKGGVATEFLDSKMRDTAAEDAYLKAKATKTDYTGPKPTVFTRSGRPVIPFKLNLTPDEKADLVLFMKALQGDPLAPIVAKPDLFPTASKSSRR